MKHSKPPKGPLYPLSSGESQYCHCTENPLEQSLINQNLFERCQFTVADLTFVGKRWRPQQVTPSTPKILALHGWLDNCASFDFLAPKLNADIVCIDLAGHGRSSARSHLAAYNVWLDVAELLAIADQLQWPTFTVLGHSRGAAIGFMLAATFPKRVKKLIGLDGIFPLIASAANAPQQLHDSIIAINKQRDRKPAIYKSFLAAVKIREQSVFPVTYAGALALANWGVEQNEAGFYWRYDTKLQAPSQLRLTCEQLTAFADNITADVTVLLAVQGIIHSNKQMLEILNQYDAWSVKCVQGNHHFHMTESADLIANTINTLL